METYWVDRPKPSFAEFRKMVSEIHCPGCKSRVRRIYRFRASRFLPLLMALTWALVRGLALAGPSETALIFRMTVAVILLGLAAAIWDNTYPRFQLADNSESDGPLNPPDLVSKS